jgi:hypothetical protein
LKKVDINYSSCLYIIQTEDDQFIGSSYCIDCYISNYHYFDWGKEYFSLSKKLSYRTNYGIYDLNQDAVDVFAGDVKVYINDGLCYYDTTKELSNIPRGRVKSIEIFTMGFGNDVHF